MYDIYHWEAHPNSSYPTCDMPERVEHYEAYLQKYPFIELPGLVDEGYGHDAEVSDLFNASYTSIRTVDLNGEIVYKKDFPNNWSGAYSGLDSKIEQLLSGIDTQAPEANVTSPSGGEELKVGETHDVTWTATDNVGVVSRSIYLTTDGSTYDLVDSSDDNTGTYSWTIPNETSINCKVKVNAYDAMGNMGSDESGVFSIGPTSIINNLSEANKMITIRKNSQSYSIYLPFSGNYTVAISDVQGKLLTSFTTANGIGWYNVPASLSSGMHIVSIKTPGRTINRRFWYMR